MRRFSSSRFARSDPVPTHGRQLDSISGDSSDGSQDDSARDWEVIGTNRSWREVAISSISSFAADVVGSDAAEGLTGWNARFARAMAGTGASAAVRTAMGGKVDFVSLAADVFGNAIGNRFCVPGVIFPDVMEMHKASSTMSDIYFAHPFLWDDRLRSTKIGGSTIAWLLAVPVAKTETSFAKLKGPQALEALFEEKDIDIFDLNRAPIV
jgi:hypothetical protein